ncbi:ankyrin repeat-containing protein [Anaeramoeba ignava]|uniref:Ankyrin repeat-containing protein n=1 Tax=Anaeramoeba ignava TaxID=1746090 RepID=A0A9Q0LL65_ANAIG|nr:ankyrin repeat-containing protein [Anaeramoeba ignava]
MDALLFNFFEEDERIETLDEYDDDKFNSALDFFEAIDDKKSFEELDEILKNGSDVNSVNFETPLFYVISKKMNLEMIKYLCDRNANLFFTNNCNENALHYALKFNLSIDIIQFLISKKIDINAQNKETVLHIELDKSKPNIEIIKLLIESGANLDLLDEEDYLSLAIRNNSLERVEMILQFQTDLEYNNKRSYLTFAIFSGCSIEIIEKLIEKGMDINAEDFGDFPVLLACKHEEYKKLLDLLFNKGIDDIKISNNENILHLLFDNHPNDPLIDELLDKGFDINQQDVIGRTILHVELQNSRNIERIKKLIKLGADLNLRDKRTPFHYLCLQPLDLEIFNLFIENGANISITDNNSPLIYILMKNSDIELIKRSINECMKTKEYQESEQKSWIKPFSTVISNKNTTPEIIQLFVDANIDIKLLNKGYYFYRGIISQAIRAGQNISVIKKLLSFNLELNPKEYSSPSPIYVAIEQCPENNDLIKLLIEAGCDVNNRYYDYSGFEKALINEKVSIETIKLFIEAGGDLNAKYVDRWGYSDDDNEAQKYPIILIRACQTPTYEKIKFLIDSNVLIDTTLTGHYNPIFKLINVRHSDIRTYKLLLSKGFPLNNQHDGSTLLTQAIQYIDDNPIDIVKLFIQEGADVNLAFRKNPLVAACERNNIEIINLLLENGAKLEFEYENTTYSVLSECIYYKRINKDTIEFLIKKGANVSFQNYNSLMHNVVSYSTAEILELLLINGANPNQKIYEKIGLLINYGANIMIETKNLYQPIKKWIKKYRVYHNNFLELMEIPELFDYIITTNEGSYIRINKTFLQSRIGEENMEKALDVFASYSEENVKQYLKCLYLSFGTTKEERKNFKEISQKIGINDYKKKFGRPGLRNDLRKIYENEKTSDFSIIKDDQEIKVHKFVLAARSGLFKGMFISVKDDSCQVNDYSKFSYQTLKALIYYFYFDEFEKDLEITDKLIGELIEAKDYYQIDPKSIFDTKIKEFKQKRILEKNIILNQKQN